MPARRGRWPCCCWWEGRLAPLLPSPRRSPRPAVRLQPWRLPSIWALRLPSHRPHRLLQAGQASCPTFSVRRFALPIHRPSQVRTFGWSGPIVMSIRFDRNREARRVRVPAARARIRLAAFSGSAHSERPSMRVGPSRPRRLNRPGRRHTPNQRPIRSTTSWASGVLRDQDREEREKSSHKFGDRIHDVLGHSDHLFKSDHVFDQFISPVTNPFLFEDPRSLTEVRPIFMYQQIPGRQPDMQGGNIWFFGTQARLAVTDRLSFVFSKLGGLSVNPGSGSVFPGQTGFSELWLGPKYTFIRNEEAARVMAGGLQFQIPVGNKDVFQDTGSLSLVPYLSYAESFFRDWSVGSVNAMVNTGWAVSVNRLRSDYYYLSGHVDLDVGNCHRFYPLMEMNWIMYTSNGTSRPIGSEGRDLINFGGQASGNGMVTWAIGARYKISESAQIGAAFELPVVGPRDIFRYRFTLDFILRY